LTSKRQLKELITKNLLKEDFKGVLDYYIRMKIKSKEEQLLIELFLQNQADKQLNNA